MSAFGLSDSFCMRHPDEVAFMHISKSGGSRFDQLWIRLATGATLQVVNATIIWKWQYPTDHAPVLADIACSIPIIEGTSVSNTQPKLRKVLQKGNDPKTSENVVRAIRERIDSKKGPLKEVRRKSGALSTSLKVTHPGDDMDQSEGIHLDFLIPADNVRAIIDEAYGVIEKQMLESIPWPNKSKFRKLSMHGQCVRVFYRPLTDIMKKCRIANTSSRN